ncbi:hypothetical protein HDU98_006352, partial [Podochytrium sp. JEL0797]
MGRLLRRTNTAKSAHSQQLVDEDTKTTLSGGSTNVTHVFRLLKEMVGISTAIATDTKKVTHTLRLITVNDVYKMNMLPSLATAIEEIKKEGVPVFCLLPGDFISPSLLSSLDKGFGMIDVLNQTGIDFVCFGNHEDDIDFASLTSRIAQSDFKWVNTNMSGLQVEASMREKVPTYSVIEVPPVAGRSPSKRVALLGLCTDDSKLYKPHHFGGAIMEPVNGTAIKYATEVLQSESIDLVIPMTHQDIERDRNLATTGLFPIIVGGHEHEPFLENISGSQIVKTGADATQFSIVDIQWSSGSEIPRVSVQLKDTDTFAPNQRVLESVQKHLRAVDLLKESVLCRIPDTVVLSSRHVRRRPTTMSIFLCSIVRDAMNAECALINAGTFRGNKKYPIEVKKFTYMDLEAEMPFPSEIALHKLPGRVINAIVAFSRAPALQTPPIEKGGYMQSCDAIKWDPVSNRVISIHGEPLDPERLYATAISYQTVAGLDNIEPLLEHLGIEPNDPLSVNGSQEYDFIGAKELIVSRFCLSIWHDMLLSESFDGIDSDRSGAICKDEIYAAFSRHYQGDEALSQVVVDNLFSMADASGDGMISRDEFLSLQLFAIEEIDFHGHHMDDAGSETPPVIAVEALEREVGGLLPGDFISPSLLSSLDKGFGMIDVLNQTGIDFVCFGNHEDDIDFASLTSRIAQSEFKWVNTNMSGLQVEASMREKVPTYSVIEVPPVAGRSPSKRVALLGLCTDDSKLYKPHHFGGAIMEPVNGTAIKYATEVLQSESIDLVIPMTHQDIERDRNLATTGLFPIIVGGHEHEPFLENISGSQIVKTGADATQFSIVDIQWSYGSEIPRVSVQLKDTDTFAPNQRVLESVQKHLRAVDLLKESVLCRIPDSIILSSRHVRRRPTTMSIFLCSIVRDAVNAECALINAGTFRGNKKYPVEVKKFTYMDLEAEMPFPSEMSLHKLPGRVINAILAFSRAPALQTPPIEKGGYMQSCDAIKWDPVSNRVISIHGEPLDPERLYATAISYQTVAGLDNIEPLLEHLGIDPNYPLSANGSQEYDFIGAKELIVSRFCLSIWHDMLLSESFDGIDSDRSGAISKDEIYAAFCKHYQGDEALSQVVVDNLFSMADASGDGMISRDEFLSLQLFAIEEIDFHGHHMDDAGSETPPVIAVEAL